MTSWKAYSHQKIIAPQNISTLVANLRNIGKTIATLNGSFDLLHAGHLYILYEASKCADVLIMAVNSDESIRTYKNPDRPIIPLKYRMEMLSAIEFINYITWFDETDPREILMKIKPDTHVNGVEYGENCIEAEVVKQQGGKLHIVDLIPGLSTSEILKKIEKTCV